MTFTAGSTRNGTTTVITLEGELDAVSAPMFRDEIEDAAGSELDELVLDMTNLTYLSSSGLRGLLFAKQKLPEGVRVVLAGANDTVEQTIRLVGFHRSVEFRDRV